MSEGVTVEKLRERIAAVQAAKYEAIARVNALIGRETELAELIALIDAEKAPTP